MLIRFVGYGSLMSARGLGTQLDGLVALSLFHVDSVRRFAKPSQRGGCLAMDVATPTATLQGHALTPGEAPSHQGFEGVLMEVEPGPSPGLARREGFPADCWQRLLDAAGAAGPGAFLCDLAREADSDVLAYRRALHAVTDPFSLSTVHYLPHPVETLDGPAVIFVSPEVGATGCPTESAKARRPARDPLDLRRLFEQDEASYPGFDPALQARYVELCLLAAVHGVYVGDLVPEGLPELHPAAALLRRWSRDRAPLLEERAALRAALGGERYDAAFATDLDVALERSGLP